MNRCFLSIVIYEVFSGKKNFDFGRQPDPIQGTGIVSSCLKGFIIIFISKIFHSDLILNYLFVVCVCHAILECKMCSATKSC